MLLVAPPGRDDIYRVIQDVLAGRLTRAEVVSWQNAVFAECGWEVPITEPDGYWYFYSLALVDVTFPDGPFLRDSDLAEFLLDMDHQPGEWSIDNVRHLRTFEIDRNKIRWPLAVLADDGNLMAKLPSTRGTFERRGDMVEHCHLSFEQHQYLLVKQFDELAGEVLLLGTHRSPERAQALLTLLS